MELNPSTTAVVVVHMQGDIVLAEGAYGDFFAARAEKVDVVGVINRVLDAARGAGVTTVYTRVAWQPGLADLVPNSPILAMVAEAGCLVDGGELAEIIEAVRPRDGDLVVTHTRVGGFSASPLDALLRSRGIDTLLFTGVATNFSVEGTARQASDLGYRTVIVADACSAADDTAHDSSIASLGLLAEIVTSDDAVAALTGAGK